ncbi:MAG: tetratricopeptide repeat protein, partial [Candidatus Electrothrix sp. MAN1_4]|nr:tetratricopeptide repeat protein [Candidatus Electrothrix sp. MAN1_4]
DRLGDVCTEKQDYTAALEHYRRAYAICEKEEDSFSILALNKKMAAIYRKQGEQDKAMELLLDMVAHYHMNQNPKGMVEVMAVIAELYQEKGENLKAADTYRTISSIHKSFKHKRMAEEFAALAEELEHA